MRLIVLMLQALPVCTIFLASLLHFVNNWMLVFYDIEIECWPVITHAYCLPNVAVQSIACYIIRECTNTVDFRSQLRGRAHGCRALLQCLVAVQLLSILRGENSRTHTAADGTGHIFLCRICMESDKTLEMLPYKIRDIRRYCRDLMQ